MAKWVRVRSPPSPLIIFFLSKIKILFDDAVFSFTSQVSLVSNTVLFTLFIEHCLPLRRRLFKRRLLGLKVHQTSSSCSHRRWTFAFKVFKPSRSSSRKNQLELIGPDPVPISHSSCCKRYYQKNSK